MPNFIDLTGQKFNRLTVIRRGEDYRRGIPRWICRCECETEVLVRAGALKDGNTQSCGCLNKDVHREVCIERNTTHGLSKTPTYDTWVNMRARCENPNASGYEKYGARGIRVCERWGSFETFLADMGEKPSPAHSIDRIDGKKGYEPSNCRWLGSQQEQQNNRTNNVRIRFGTKERTISDWARETGLSRMTIWNRIYKLNWTVKAALTTSADPGNRFKR